MKTCKTCIYHCSLYGDINDKQCIKLNETINTKDVYDREEKENTFAIELWTLIKDMYGDNRNSWCVGVLHKTRKHIAYAITTPDWFGCVCHIKNKIK